METEKPWAEQKRSIVSAEIKRLEVVRSKLYSEIDSINDQILLLRTAVVNSYEDPGQMGYGKTETALDVKPPKSNIAGIIRSFRHPYSVD